ncbi:DISARM system phospholipase D-like protein DrmC [Microbulbifer harenosus]|uniref:Phospholipase n=2 Tax=Microbulbifer harenosus TaxID=2576840 RepID=A0ABY2URI7_9GAMM|nr:DISARM system phospholipase D-like protein DrmC [Microbulbifer harenosus]TLM79160.1 phospholipase [Microbulbifer harenosus]
MNQLMEAVTDLASNVSPERLDVIAKDISKITSSDFHSISVRNISTPVVRQLVENLFDAWKRSPVSALELAAMLRGASCAYLKAKQDVTAELIWSGPRTPIVSTRQTEQALLEVIDSAEDSLFIVSFVIYKVPLIFRAIEAAINRKVSVSMLLESSDQHGGSISVDAIGKIKADLPDVTLYCWNEKKDDFVDARVHAKAAVADRKKCFVSSANLTGHAMDKNMEAGVMITGGSVPTTLQDQLTAMITTRIIREV